MKSVLRTMTAAVCGTALMAGALATSGSVAAAAPPAGDQSAQLQAMADLQRQIGVEDLRGLAGSVFEPDGRTVRLYWAGPQPTALRQFTARAQAADIAITSVPYNQEQIVKRSRALIKAAKKRNIPIGAVSSTADFRGLLADVDPSATAEQRAALQELGADEIREGSATMVPLARYSDTSPFWAGAAIQERGANPLCSTGFAARTSSGTVGMVTAYHCGTNTDWTTPTVFGYPERTVGRSNAGHLNTDSALITGGAYSAFMYRGDWASNTGRQISSIGNASVNQKVCSGGGLSGEVCNATVDTVNVTGPNGAGPGYFAKTSSSSVPLAGQGDSGGPGFAVAASTNNITILGIVSSAYATEKATDCTGGTSNPWNNSVPARLCFFRVHFVNAKAIESALGVTGLTSS